METIKVYDSAKKSTLQVQVSRPIARRCRSDAAYTRALFSQISNETLGSTAKSIRITPIESPSMKRKREYWNDGEMRELLNVYGRNEALHHKRKKWRVISAELAKKGIKKSSECCRQKWIHLVKQYEEAIKFKSANRFDYFEKVHSILHGDRKSEELFDAFRQDSNENSVAVANKQTFWTEEQISRLIKMYVKHEPKKNSDWLAVAKDLLSEGINKNAKQCATKWKHLLYSYRRCKKYDDSHGFKFFDVMKRIVENDEDLINCSDVIEIQDENEDLESSDDETNDDEDMPTNFEEIIIETDVDHNNSWSKDATLSLIESFQRNVDENAPSNVLWRRISEEMDQKSSDECKKMWEYLYLEYIRRKDEPEKFQYFDEVDRIFTKKKRHKPGDHLQHHDLCECFEKKARDKDRRHRERLEVLKRKMDIEDRKVAAFEKYVERLNENNIHTHVEI